MLLKKTLLIALLSSCIHQATAALQPLKPEPHYPEAAFISAQILSSVHYQPKPLNNTLSVQIFESYLETLDHNRQFFTQADINSMLRARTQMDDAILRRKLYLPYQIYNAYQKRMVEYLEYAQSLLDQGFDFTIDEQYQFDRSEAPWPVSEEAMKTLWRKRTKNDWLMLKLAGKDDDAIRERLKKRYTNSLNFVYKNSSEDVFQAFMNAYAMSIEPHTNYLAPRTMDNFNISMQLSLVGIGATLQLRDEYTTIRELIPGGPAAMSKQLKPGDRIVGVGQGEDSIPVDVIGWRIDDVVDLIRGKKDTVVVLNILPAGKNNTGQYKRVTLVRDKIKLEEQAAKKDILEIKRDNGTIDKIGVITLPSFYRDFQAFYRGEKDYRSASRDVEKLLKQLKQEDVSAVLLDLRNNGGGSLTEAIDVTGLFIKKGPVVQQHNASGEVSIEYDEDAKIVWEGPLGVMINRSSASASEILAAAIQDYRRGIIIGEPSFGKGTVQTLLNLDDIAENEQPLFGELKLTSAQFFRINGGTTQLKGVIPDIELPSVGNHEDFGESSYDNALPWKKIKPAEYTPHYRIKQILPTVKKQHQARMTDNQEFQYLLEDIEFYKEKQDRKFLSLNYETRKQEREEQQARLNARKDLDEQQKKAVKLTRQLQNDGLLSNERDIKQEISLEKARENIKDIMLDEAAYILSDMHRLSAKKTAQTR